MNILSVLGSPRRDGNTAVLLNSILDGMRENKDAHIDNVVLDEMGISPCMNCDFCRESGDSICCIEDDMQELYDKIRGCSIMILATPIYWWNMSAQLKTFIDRFYCLGKGNDQYPDLQGKKILLVMTYGGELPNSGPEIVEKSIREIAEYTGMEVIGVMAVCSESPVAENKEELKKAYELGKRVVS